VSVRVRFYEIDQHVGFRARSLMVLPEDGGRGTVAVPLK
jgi:hypothetical protein